MIEIPTQENIERAIELAFEAMDGQTAEQMSWLGAKPAGDAWRLPVLNETFEVNLETKSVDAATGGAVGNYWRIPTLHYLAVNSRPDLRLPELSFADLQTARSYAGVYNQRVIARLCATVGRDEQTLRAAAEGLGGRTVAAGDAAFDFDVFPRLTLRLIWHAADEEFPPSATLLLPANIESYLPIEDVTVLSELLVSRLCGHPW